MNKLTPAVFPLGFVFHLILALYSSVAISSAEPGATVRNAFGPEVGLGANQCRGACGGGCPQSCEITVRYECTGESQLRRVEAYTCGTHQGCREHDDCLDNCLQDNSGSSDCQARCDAEAMQRYGFEKATPWLMGKGPYDGEITFEYTRQAPSDLEPAYRCPQGAERKCNDGTGCVATNGGPVDPVFDSYPSADAGAMRISALHVGPLCDKGDERVCKQSSTIQILGEDSCPSGNCTRFGMEFDYRNADPTMPLECKTSTRGGDSDFIGDLVKLGGDAIAERDAASGGPEPDDGMGQLLSMFGKVIASADSPEDLQISITPLDENGNPIESQRVGSETGDAAPIPRSVELPAERGHLLVPMYQLVANSRPGTAKERRVTCTHKGEAVLETVFVLQH